MSETVASEKVAFKLEHFLKTMDMLLHEPNIISPAILRAEVLQDKTTAEKEENGWKRIVQRVLVPKQTRDPRIWQQILYDFSATGSDDCSVTHSCFNDESFKTPANADDLPYFYPKFDSFCYHYQAIPATVAVEGMIDDALVERGIFSISVACKDRESIDKLLDNRIKDVFAKVCKKVLKICVGTMNGYKKRVHHDLVIPKIAYQDKYRILKEKYSEWVEKWPEDTDPSKHVFEDIGIATWLILLFEQQALSLGKTKHFVDLGCGNGFLTYILLNEGFSGIGIDLSRRKLWDLFPPSIVHAKLVERPIFPKQEDFTEFEFIIGNHSDELTPWVPVIARRDSCRWMVIPCCLFELNGRKFTKSIPELGRYKTYCQHLIDFSRNNMGYGDAIEVEHLRIPSTKNVCIVMRQEAKDGDFAAETESKKALARKIIQETEIVLRKTDREKQQVLRDKKNARLQNKT